jgi:hypothetical protein
MDKLDGRSGAPADPRAPRHDEPGIAETRRAGAADHAVAASSP